MEEKGGEKSSLFLYFIYNCAEVSYNTATLGCYKKLASSVVGPAIRSSEGAQYGLIV